MENYNLTAELKKIASGITSSDPNTELGNINSGVGNLDTAMQSVATAINNISIPNPGSNIDGVATAINNKTIPDNSSNITAVANAIISLAGGQDLSDLITILTTMNGNIANLGSNHIVNIVENPSGYLMYKGDGTATPLPNQAIYTTYTDTNNIGATDVQSAVDYTITNKVDKPSYNYQIPAMVINQSSPDCNTFTSFGLYQVSNASNTPGGGSGWYTILVIPMGSNNANYCQQFAVNLNNHTLWHRYRNAGTWSSWVTI